MANKHITLKTYQTVTKTITKSIELKVRLPITGEETVNEIVDGNGKLSQTKCIVKTKDHGDHICKGSFQDIVNLIECKDANITGFIKE